jgi:NADH-quinone oxidoreductase subunit C
MEETKILDDLRRTFPGKILVTSAALGDTTIFIQKEALREIAEFLKKKPYNFTMLLDLTCVDRPGSAERFEMVYHLYALGSKLRLRLKVGLPESGPSVDSLSPLWKNANWLEREIFDMFGVEFRGHPDARRLLMYDGFEGHPLRKDYPFKKRQPIIPLRK